MSVTDGVNPSTSVPMVPAYGKDSMNFAEWPLAVLHAKRRHDEPVTIADTVRHPKTGEQVERSLTIDPSRKYGHPTSPDVDVLLGMIQITAERGFSDPVVSFSRYELQKTIRWSTGGYAIRRIDESIRRWKSITLTYKRAWWDVEREDWVSISFNPIATAYFYDKPRHPIRIEWHKYAFADFTTNIKPLNLDTYFALRRAGSKQLFCYLDKHWHRRPRLTYDLKHAASHAGYNPQQPNKKLKQLLQNDCDDLEQHQALKPIPSSQRFEQVRRGQWKVHFHKPSRRLAPTAPTKKQTPVDDLTQQLIDRKITRGVAATLVKNHTAQHIQDHLAIFDWYNAKPNKQHHKKPGWLRKAIEENYAAPNDYQTPAQREARAKQIEARQQRRDQQDKQRQDQKAAELQRLDDYYLTIPTKDRQQIEQEAFDNAGAFNLKRYRDAQKAGDEDAIQTWHQTIIRNQIRKLID